MRDLALLLGGAALGLLAAALSQRKATNKEKDEAKVRMPQRSAVFGLDGKVCVVTGGASGIGLSISKLFARQGGLVHILDINAAETAAVAESINADVGRLACFSHTVDITDALAVKGAFESIVAQHGGVHILVNNAGVVAVGTLEKCTEADLDRVYKVNVKGVYNCSLNAVSAMKAAGIKGSIVNLASIASILGLPDRFAYSMSKGAVLTMTYSIAADYVKDGIRCNAICPARVFTPLVEGYLKRNYAENMDAKYKELCAYQPIGRMGTPDEIAYLALYLASDESSFVTGVAYPIDGGVSCHM